MTNTPRQANQKIHYSGYAASTPSAASGTACRPDGQADRRLIATSVKESVTCKACAKVMLP